MQIHIKDETGIEKTCYKRMKKKKKHMKKESDLANRNVLTQVKKKSFENFWRERFLN